MSPMNVVMAPGAAPFNAVPPPHPSATPASSTKDGGEEHKSDTTSSSTVPNAVTPNGHNNAVTPANVVAAVPVPVYAYGVNPYLSMPLMANPMNPMNPMMSNTFGVEPNMDHFHMQNHPFGVAELNQMQTLPPLPGECDLPHGPYYVVKVSCVATGPEAEDRSVGHIALVDWSRKTKANIFVKPEEPIQSYLHPLTSLTPKLLNTNGFELDKAVEIIRGMLPKDAVLVGQNITMDLQWLGLVQGQDFASLVDLRDVWRRWAPQYNSYTHYSLGHQSKCILGLPITTHSASTDATITMKLFQYYLYCRKYSIQLLHSKIGILHNTRIEPSFAKRNPTFEGVQMQSKKYKGVPYITAYPQRRLTPTKLSSSSTPKGNKALPVVSPLSKQDSNDTKGNTDNTADVDSEAPQSTNANAPIDPPKSTDAAAIV